MRSSAQARAYATELRAVLVASGASDGKMEEGSMRVDANVSVRRSRRRSASAPGARSRTSTRCVRWAGPSTTRPTARSPCIEAGEAVVQQTRHWDEDAGRTVSPALEGGRLRLPLLPRARPGAPGSRRRVGPGRGRHHGSRCPAARRSRLVGCSATPTAATRAPRSTRWPRWSTWAWTTLVTWRRRPPGCRPAWPWPARPTRRPPTPRRPAGLDPQSYVALLTMEADRVADRHPGQDGPGRAAGRRWRRSGRHRRGQGVRGHVRGLAGRRGGRGGGRPSRRVGPLSRRGRGRELAGFFTGAGHEGHRGPGRRQGGPGRIARGYGAEGPPGTRGRGTARLPGENSLRRRLGRRCRRRPPAAR